MKKILILAIIALSMLVSVSAGVDIPDANMTINEAGTYVLSEDMFVSNEICIWINASNVILDGNARVITSNSTTETVGIYAYNGGGIENITIQNLKIENVLVAAYVGYNVKNITITNCEFENNTYFLDSYAFEQYFYLNTIHDELCFHSYTPLSSPKLVYNYNGNEYTYRLGNYYYGYEGTETEDEGVYKGAYELYDYYGEEVLAYDPYVLIEMPENYEILEILYPDVELEYDEAGSLIADIFALTSDPENYVITDAPVTPTTSSSSSSRGGGGSAYDSDIADDIESKIIKNFVSSATVLFGNGVDEQYAVQLRERVTDANGFTIYGNTIIIGGPEANAFAKEYNNQFEIPISNDNPGENKGVIQILKVQDTSGKVVKSYTIVYIAGSDRLGTEAALEYFKTLDELPEGPITVEWTQNGPVLV